MNDFENSMYWRAGLSDEPLEEEREAMNFNNISPRLTPEQVLARSAAIGMAEASARRHRWIGFCILLGTITAFVVLVVELVKGF